MKKVIYLFFFVTFIILTGCSNSGDGSDEPIPPPSPITLDEDALIGVWETYYFEKQVTVNPGEANQSFYGGLRYTDYDGFRSEFLKESGKYKSIDYNLLEKEVTVAEYYVKDDTIKFERTVKTEDGRDSIAKTWQRIREFNPSKGILKLDQSYYGFTKDDGIKFKITDAKVARKVPSTTTEGVIPAKVMIDYNNLCEGKWQVYLYRYYEDGSLNKRRSELMTDTLSTVSYNFYLKNGNEKRCKVREWDFKVKTEVITDYPIVVVDDVIQFLYKRPLLDKDKKPVYENGNEVLVDDSFFMWVTSWQKRDGVDSFIDFNESRFEENVKVIVKSQMYLKRVEE